MAGWRQPIELALSDLERAALEVISRSRTQPARRVERARILLTYPENLSFSETGRIVGVHHQTVQRIVERAAFEGPKAALDDRPRPGKRPGS
jgi:ActR/RegA family two-component response regulator